MVNRVISYMLDDYHALKRAHLFRRLMYALVLLQCGAWTLQFDLLFGANSVVVAGVFPAEALHRPAFLLFRFTAPFAAGIFIAIAALLAALLLLAQHRLHGWLSVGLHLLLWLLMLNLHNRIYAALTGGHFLLNQFLFFQAFLSAGRFPALAPDRPLIRLLHNLAVVAIVLQLMLVYLMSAWAKLQDPMWLNGSALSLISQIRHYAPGNGFAHLGVISMLINYAVIVYQLLFPFSLLFPRSIKMLFLAAGLLMHLFIALAMGLGSFGLVMMAGYVFFWPRSSKDVVDTSNRT